METSFGRPEGLHLSLPNAYVVLPFYFPSFSTAVSAKFNSKGEERGLDSKGV